MNIRVLGSTSSGNCTLIWDDRNAIMIDCGFGPKYICQNLQELKLDISSLSGVLITHTHGDHVKGSMLKRLVKEKIPMFCHHRVWKDLVEKHEVMQKADSLGLLQAFMGEEFETGSFTAQSFEVSHDSPGGCFGFNIFRKARSGMKKVTIATDLGCSQGSLIKRLADSDAIIIESNHDVAMLEKSDRPQWLKQRIRKVHLSNDQCAVYLAKAINVSEKKPKAVILAHISQDCNTNSLARNRMRHTLDENDHSTGRVFLTHRMKASEIVRI